MMSNEAAVGRESGTSFVDALLLAMNRWGNPALAAPRRGTGIAQGVASEIWLGFQIYCIAGFEHTTCFIVKGKGGLCPDWPD